MRRFTYPNGAARSILTARPQLPDQSDRRRRALGRQSESVPNCNGSKPMPATHSPTNRAYCRIISRAQGGPCDSPANK